MCIEHRVWKHFSQSDAQCLIVLIAKTFIEDYSALRAHAQIAGRLMANCAYARRAQLLQHRLKVQPNTDLLAKRKQQEYRFLLKGLD